MSGQLLIISGPPGAGKSTVSRHVAELFERAICLESDWFWSAIVKGFVEPWKAEAHDQNVAVVRAYVSAAASLAAGGFPVVLDALLGPWFIDLVAEECAHQDVEFHYVILRPAREVSRLRATSRLGQERVPGRPALVDEEPVLQLWDRFANLGEFEADVIDNSEMSPEETAVLIYKRWGFRGSSEGSDIH